MVVILNVICQVARLFYLVIINSGIRELFQSKEMLLFTRNIIKNNMYLRIDKKKFISGLLEAWEE